jgi:DNA-binding winged helix-turn-helix (wHTH) protein
MAEMRAQPAAYAFDRFTVDPADRRLLRDGEPQDISSRYFDALLLLLEERGRLVPRDRFLDEVWAGVPVTDEALSQCIAQLRRLLGDNPTRPAFIETVPKHGYRFVAPVEVVREGTATAAPTRAQSILLPQLAVTAITGTVGGALAGAVGGLIYGLGATGDPLQPAVGAASFLLVMLSVTILAGAIGGLAVGLGIAVAWALARPALLWTTAGAAMGGFVVGGATKLLGVDAFSILLGTAPAAVGGGLEGLVLGGAVGLGSHLSLARARPWPSVTGAALAGCAAGALLPLLGGRLMAASLDALTAAFPGSRLDIDPLGRWFGEDHFGMASQIGFGAIEGLLFGAGVALAFRHIRPLLRGLVPA